MISSGYIYVLLTIIFTVTSQLLIKWKMSTKYVDVPDVFYDKVIFFSKVLLDPFIILSIILIFFSGVSWMIAMSKFDLSSIYPLVVAGLMLFTSIFAIIFFNELISLTKILGILLILIGVIILYKGSQ